MPIEPRRPTAKGPPDWFTGDVYLDGIVRGEEPSRVRVSAVRFTPSARTAWHSHALGQTLYVTDGEGHDRGARCAYRLALDEPDAVVRLAVMDVVPVGSAYDRADKKFSVATWVWSFLAAPEPVPEQFIGAAPSTLVNYMLDSWPVVKDAFPDEVRAEYIEKFRDSDTAHAICEEYRASATLDYERDEKDHGNRKIACPVLFLWGERGSVAPLYDDPLAIWREWADDVRGASLPVGHFIPEEAPDETARRLLDFLP